MKSNCTFYDYNTLLNEVLEYINPKWLMLILVMLGMSFNGYSQKDKDIIPTVDCIRYAGNGIYQASFGYENPTKKEVVIDENGSIIKSNNGKRVAKGLNKFNAGNNNKVFTKEFGAHDYIEWTIISNNNSHTVVANINSLKCELADSGFIFPVYGQGNGKSTELVGQELSALADGIAGETPNPLVFQINNEKVLIEIVPKNGQIENVISLLKGTFGVLDTDFLLAPEALKGLAAIDVYFPINRLSDLGLWSDYINFIRPVYSAVENQIGLVSSQGDSIQTSDIVRESFKLIKQVNGKQTLNDVDGTGITIGVMSNSFDTKGKASLDILNEDLPGVTNTKYTLPIEVLKEYPNGNASDEGRAMMHIIHDVAPGAKLAFHTGTLSPRNFEIGFNALKEGGCDIIVDDITFVTEPFFGESRISTAIKAFTDDTHRHFTSAGNFANNGYQGAFNSTTTVPVTNFISQGSDVRAHVFDVNTGDYLQKISVIGGETYMIVLQWDDSFASQNNTNGAYNDLDFYIVDNSGRLLVGNNRSNENGDAIEIMVFSTTGDGEANILITSATGATNVPFRYIAYKSTGLNLMEYNSGTPTISGHAMTPESVTVGAIRFNKTESESFSSFGGLLTNGNAVEVDFSAPDGVNTAVASFGQNFYKDGTAIDNDDYPNFFGTSASAPSAAAAVALLQSALPTWYPNGYSKDIIQLFKENAKGNANVIQAGAGMIDVNKVFNTLASQTAKITSFTILENEDGTTPTASIEPVKIKIIGKFFPSQPLAGESNPIKVYLDGIQLTGSIQDDGSIEAIIPPFSGNPDLQLYTEPKPGSVNNGGFSEPFKFFQDGKMALSIIANPDIINSDGSTTPNPAKVIYGEDYTSLLNYKIEGINLLPSETYEEARIRLGLPEIVLTTTADAQLPYPDVYNYAIIPSFKENSTYDETKYVINFINGSLFIEIRDLLIKPFDEQIVYGDAPDLYLNYLNSDGSEIADRDFFYMIKSAHQSDFYNSENYLALINRYEAEVNRMEAEVNTTYNIENLLLNGSFISTENAILNRMEPLVNRMDAEVNRMEALVNVLNLDVNHFVNYLQNRYEAEVNRMDAEVNRMEAVVNAGDLFDGLINMINRMDAEVNRMEALVNADDSNDYTNVFAVIDAEDNSSTTLTKFYALNVITGLDVTLNNTDSHYIVPGGFLNPLSDNFNMTFETGRLKVIPATLTVPIEGVTIEYGETPNVPDPDLSEQKIQGYWYGDTTQDVFPDGIPYYFKNTDTNDTKEYVIGDKMNVGTYNIYIRDVADNYTLSYGDIHGQLTIIPATLTVETTTAANIKYGGTPDITIIISGFPYNDEDVSTLFPEAEGGISYFFMKQGETPNACADCKKFTVGGEDKMAVGVYDIFITDQLTDNYKIDFAADRGMLIVETASLTIKTNAFSIEYGDPVSAAINTTITGFVFSDENETTVFTDGIPYLFVKGTDLELDINSVKALGTYKIEVSEPVSGNYSINYEANHGDLTITEATLTFETETIAIKYGETPQLAPHFDGFAYDESDNVLMVNSKMPYYFMKDGISSTLEDLADMNIGVYEIFITDNVLDNYKFYPDTKLGTLYIDKTTLYITISPDELIVNQGSLPALTTTFDSGNAYNEDINEVFPDGITYEFEDEEFGDIFLDTSIPGVFKVRITDPTNYEMAYNNDAILYVNPFNDEIKKVRNFADCVSYNISTDDYTATYRYENNNLDPVFASLGADNYLSGPAAETAYGLLPTIFLPGSGTFQIHFNGDQLIWNLTTYEGTHKSSVSSASTEGTGECEAKLDGAYKLYPNPVTTDLFIKQNIIESSKADVYNMYGLKVIDGPSFNGNLNTEIINLGHLPDGLYIIRIVSATDIRTFNIIKQN